MSTTLKKPNEPSPEKAEGMDVAKKGKKRPLEKSPEPVDRDKCKEKKDPSTKEPEDQPSPKKVKHDAEAKLNGKPSSPADTNPKAKSDESTGETSQKLGKTETNLSPPGDLSKLDLESKPSSGLKFSFSGFSGFGGNSSGPLFGGNSNSNAPLFGENSGLSWGLGDNKDSKNDSFLSSLPSFLDSKNNTKDSAFSGFGGLGSNVGFSSFLGAGDSSTKPGDFTFNSAPKPKDELKTPKVQLKGVPEETGEDDKNTTHSFSNVKVYEIVDEKYQERGLGSMKLLDESDKSKRLVCRREGTKKVMLNVLIEPEIKFTLASRFVRFTAPSLDGKHFSTYLIKPGSKKVAEMHKILNDWST